MKEIQYNSCSTGQRKTIPQEIIDEMFEYLKKQDIRIGVTTVGEIQDILLNFKRSNGSRLLINQLEPFFVGICLYFSVEAFENSLK